MPSFSRTPCQNSHVLRLSGLRATQREPVERYWHCTNPHLLIRPLSTFCRPRPRKKPDSRAFVFLETGELEAAQLTYAQLELRARSVAARLQVIARPGDRALLLYPAGLDFIVGFLGCLYAGVVAVPAYPFTRGRLADRLKSMVQDCSPRVALMDLESLHVLERKGSGGSLGHVPAFAIDPTNEPEDEVQALASHWRRPELNSNSLAFLQYTSGSTGSPKGVMVSHGNILANVAEMARCIGADQNTIGVNWLPLFHDMGLLGTVLVPIFVGGQSILMDPAAFMQRPVRWLQAISRYRGTHLRRARLGLRPVRAQGERRRKEAPGPEQLGRRAERR